LIRRNQTTTSGRKCRDHNIVYEPGVQSYSHALPWSKTNYRQRHGARFGRISCMPDAISAPCGGSAQPSLVSSASVPLSCSGFTRDSCGPRTCPSQARLQPVIVEVACIDKGKAARLVTHSIDQLRFEVSRVPMSVEWGGEAEKWTLN
jgi:hypothetical protein